LLLDTTLKLCALVVLENPADRGDTRPALLIELEEAENLSMLHAAQQAVQSAMLSAPSLAAVEAAVEAAAEAGAAVAQQERLRLLLRVVSLLGSCVNVMARDQQQPRHLSWGQVASRCGRIAELCFELAGYEQALEKQRQPSTQEAAGDILGALDAWCESNGISLPSDASMDFVPSMLAQHPYARQLMSMNIGGLHAVLQQCIEDPKLPADQAVWDTWDGPEGAAARAAAAALAAEPSAAPEHVLLAALLHGSLSEVCLRDDAAPCSAEESRATGMSDRTPAASVDACSGRACSSSVLTTLDVKLACMAVAVRAMRLYGTVLEAALSHPCLNRSTSAEERSAGAAQLAQQLDRLQASGERVLLPDVIQQQMLDSGRQQCLESPSPLSQGAAAAIGALLGDVPGDLRQVKVCIGWVRSQLSNWGQPQSTCGAPSAKGGAGKGESAAAPFQLIIDTSVLQRDGERLELMVTDTAEQSWQELQELCIQLRSPRSSDSSEEELTANETAEVTTAWVQAAVRHSKMRSGRYEVLQRFATDVSGHGDLGQKYVSELRSQLDHSDYGPADLGPQLRSWADAVAASLPSRRCCANPCCVSLRE
jgi:hypothetical protein